MKQRRPLPYINIGSGEQVAAELPKPNTTGAAANQLRVQRSLYSPPGTDQIIRQTYNNRETDGQTDRQTDKNNQSVPN